MSEQTGRAWIGLITRVRVALSVHGSSHATYTRAQRLFPCARQSTSRQLTDGQDRKDTRDFSADKRLSPRATVLHRNRASAMTIKPGYTLLYYETTAELSQIDANKRSVALVVVREFHAVFNCADRYIASLSSAFCVSENRWYQAN